MSIRSIAVLPLLIAGLAITPLHAQIASPDPAKVEAGSYKVETTHAQIIVGISHFGFNDYFGTLSGVDGKLEIDPARPAAASIDVTVPISSLTTSSETLDGTLQSADWFNAAEFPTARFVSTAVTPTGAGTARIEGNLTLHGVTKPITLEATFVGSGLNPMNQAVTVGFSATGKIDRTEFGITRYAPVIGNDVTLTISAAFEKSA